MTYRTLYGEYFNSSISKCACCNEEIDTGAWGTDSLGRGVRYCSTECKDKADGEFNAFCEALDMAEMRGES